MPGDPENGPIRRVERYLDRLLGDEQDAPDPAETRARAGARRPAAEAPAGPRRALLAVDDAGDFLLCGARAPVIGHARGLRADLPVLADVGVAHARFERRTSLAGGEEWWILPLGPERVLRNVEPVSTAAVLADGDVLRLGGNLDVAFRLPDPASATALLELKGPVDCLGATRVLLLAEGPAGRVRVGASAGRHVCVPNREEEVALELEGSTLRLSSAAGLATPGVEPRRELALPFPPPRRLDVTVGRPLAAGRPPFALALVPIAVPGAAGAPGTEAGGTARGFG